MKIKSSIGIFLLCGLILGLGAAASGQMRKGRGPSVVAKVDRHLWPEAVDTAAGFDRASRAAILIYARSLQEMKSLPDAELFGELNARSFDRGSIDQWLDAESKRAADNYRAASAKNCPSTDWTCVSGVNNFDELTARARTLKIPAALGAWQNNFEEFVREYLVEQIRLAALFPRTTSEIATFNANEWTGDELPDRKFFLTFDDGPTAPSGNTDAVLAMLEANRKTGVFFVLGENFQSRLARTGATPLAGIYRGQCIALHGWQHQSHAKWLQWQKSVTDTQNLLKTTFGEYPGVRPLFRPPYGQRRPDSGAFFQRQGLQIALWNLDSQDWNAQVDAEDVINRILTLMLIKRHGVLLFHDIHPKAARAVPAIIKETGAAVDWGDCQQLGNAPQTNVSSNLPPPADSTDLNRDNFLCRLSAKFCNQKLFAFGFLSALSFWK